MATGQQQATVPADDWVVPAGAASAADDWVTPPPAAEEIPSGWAAAITDIPGEMVRSTKEAAHATAEQYRAMSPEDPANRTLQAQLYNTFVGTPKLVGSAIGTALAPIAGFARAPIAHTLQEIERLLRPGAVKIHGEEKVRRAEAETGRTPGGPTYEEARREADTLLSGIAPRGGLGITRTAPAAAPAPKPLMIDRLRAPEPVPEPPAPATPAAPQGPVAVAREGTDVKLLEPSVPHHPEAPPPTGPAAAEPADWWVNGGRGKAGGEAGQEAQGG